MRGTVQQNNGRAPPTLLGRSSDQLGPLCAVTNVRLQRIGTQVYEYGAIQSDTVSSATGLDHSEPGKRHTR